MKLKYVCLGITCLALGLSQARAEDPMADGSAPTTPQTPKSPVQAAPTIPTAAPGESFAQSPAAGTAETGTFNPQMIGDSAGLLHCHLFLGDTVCDPVASLGDFKISENESPRPVDRVFFTSNNYWNVKGTSDGGVPPRSIDFYQQTFGFEKTFLDGDASIGLRVPFFEQNGSGAVGSPSDIGDLSVVLKFALINNRQTGNVLSGGLVVTAPTGPSISIVSGNVQTTLLQPWAGFIYNMDDFYVQGFSSVVIPTDSHVATILFNDLGIGYTMFRNRDGLITSLTPIFEVHVTTPLNHRDSMDDAITVPDIVDLTAGVHLGVGERGLLTLGVATPVVNSPFDVEAIAQFNLRF